MGMTFTLALTCMSTAYGMYLKKYLRHSCFDEVTELSVSVIWLWNYGEGEICANMKYIEDHLVPYSCCKIFVELSRVLSSFSLCSLPCTLSINASWSARGYTPDRLVVIEILRRVSHLNRAVKFVFCKNLAIWTCPAQRLLVQLTKNLYIVYFSFG